MDTLKGIFFGFVMYFITSIIAKVTGLNHIVLLIWAVSGVVLYGIKKNSNDKKAVRQGAFAISIIAVIGTAIIYFLETLGVYLDKWF